MMLVPDTVPALPLKLNPYRSREVVNVAALPSMLVMPVNDWLALARFRAMAVVPTYNVELPSTVDDIVPVKPAMLPSEANKVFVPEGKVMVLAAVNFNVLAVLPISRVNILPAVSAVEDTAAIVTSKAAEVSLTAKPVKPVSVPPAMLGVVRAGEVENTMLVLLVPVEPVAAVR